MDFGRSRPPSGIRFFVRSSIRLSRSRPPPKGQVSELFQLASSPLPFEAASRYITQKGRGGQGKTCDWASLHIASTIQETSDAPVGHLTAILPAHRSIGERLRFVKGVCRRDLLLLVAECRASRLTAQGGGRARRLQLLVFRLFEVGGCASGCAPCRRPGLLGNN